MAVTYLSGNESPTADKLNEIFEELDRKIGLALDQKSFLVASGYSTAMSALLMGRFFIFTTGTRIYSAGLASNYDHASVVATVAALTEVSRDDDLNIMTVSGAGIPQSLQAHTREGYYLRLQNTVFPEKKYKYAAAELVYEGIGYQTVFFPKSYDKFNFFRIHNLNPYEMSFIFEKTGGSETFTVPAMGCRCVRRDSVDGTYNGDWNYLWKAQAGDPRFFYCMATQNAAPINSMAANNVTAVYESVYGWAAAFSEGVMGAYNDALNPQAFRLGAKWHFDPHEVQDISDDYCPTYYPDPADTTQRAGNFFHHKGEMFIGETRYTFNGYQSITLDLPLLGIDNLTNETITVTPAANVTQISTNLFSQSLTSRPTVSAQTPTVLENDNIGATNLLLHDTVDVSVAVGSNLTITRETIRGALNQIPVADFSFHLDTLADVLTLNHFGNTGYAATDQNTDSCTITNRRFVFTPAGPRILFDEQINLNGSWWNTAPAEDVPSDPFGDHYATPSGAGLVRNGVVWFQGYGWPTFTMSNPGGRSEEGTILFAEVAHLSPRHPRSYAWVNGRVHPNILNPTEAADGADFSLSSVSLNNVPTEYAFATNVNLRDEPGADESNFRTWENPDGLYNGMPRVPLLKEHFNAMAQLLNSVKKITPITFVNLRLLIPSVAGGENDTVATMPPLNNLSGLAGGACPLTQYCLFETGTSAERFFQRLGVPILSPADYPDDYHDAIAIQSAVVVLQTNWKNTIIAEPSPRTFTVNRVVTGTTRTQNENQGAAFAASPGTYRWVTIGDVKARVEALGWKFVYQQAFTVHSLQVVELTDEPLHDAPGGTHTYEYYDSSVFPPSVGAEWTGAISTFYYNKRGVFVDDLDGEWKIERTEPTIYDSQPADILTAGYKVPGFEKWVIKELVCDDEDQRRALGVYQPNIGYQPKYGLAQNIYTTGLSNESVAFLLPITWADHSSPEFSRGTYDEATLGWGQGVFESTRTYADHPIEEAARAGETEYSNLANGNTLISNQGKALEIVPMWRVFVAAE